MLSDAVKLPKYIQSPTQKSNHSPAPCTTGTSPNPSASEPSRTLHAIRFLSAQVLSRLTSLRAASPASRTASPVSDSPAQTTETCGVSARELLATYDPATHSLRMSQACLPLNPGDSSTESLATWPRFGMMCCGRLYPLPPLAHPTDESESGCWPTTTSRDHKDGTARSCENVPVNGLLGRFVHSPAGRPAPASSNTSGSRQELWATPQASDPQHAGPNQRDSSGRPALPAQASKTQQGKLNPHWVATLMGYPAIWCELGRKFTTGSRNLRRMEIALSRKSQQSSSNQS